VVAATASYAEAALICNPGRALGSTPRSSAGSWEAPQLIELGGKAVENTYYSTYFSAENQAPDVRAFVQRYAPAGTARRRGRLGARL